LLFFGRVDAFYELGIVPFFWQRLRYAS
jgi:hypothetical protein